MTIKHGHSVGKQSPTYLSWAAMKSRCLNLSNDRYADYGGRGIAVCDRWRDSFAAFLEDMGERPPGRTLDRRDNDGNYEPGNCQWSTPKEQAQRRRPKTRRKPLKPACCNGHAFSPENTRINSRGERVCKECDRARARAYYHRTI